MKFHNLMSTCETQLCQMYFGSKQVSLGVQELIAANPDYYVASLDGSGKNNLHHYPGVTKHKYFLFIVSCTVNLGKQWHFCGLMPPLSVRTFLSTDVNVDSLIVAPIIEYH